MGLVGGLALIKPRQELERAMQDPKNLLEIHGELRSGPGRRIREPSLNRGAVILAVAAWQAFVQDLVRAISDFALKPTEEDDPAWGIYRLTRINAHRAVNSFGNPNAQETRNLLAFVGFDPRPHWRWRQGSRQVEPADAEQELNQWLKIRHAIAHGDDLPAYALLAEGKNGNRHLRKQNAKCCVTFIDNLSEATASGAEREF